MNIEVEKTVERILVLLDESDGLADDVQEYGCESYDLRTMIRNLLPVAAERVILGSDISELAEWLPLEQGVSRVGDEGGGSRRVVKLPDDFLRLVYLRMSDWTEAETEVMVRGSASAWLRRYWEKRDGIRSGRERPYSPALAWGYHDGRRVLEIYGSVEGSRVAEGGYLPRPVIDGGGNMNFPPSLSTLLESETARMIKEIRK